MRDAAVASQLPANQEADEEERQVTDLIEQPAKVMRIGSMIKQLLEEVRSAPLDDASRAQLKEIHQRSITELEDGLAPELVAELDRLSLPFTDESTPSDAELRIAQAQLVGWLEGLFHGIQTAMFAQQMAARNQLEEMRRQLGVGGIVGGRRPLHAVDLVLHVEVLADVGHAGLLEDVPLQFDALVVEDGGAQRAHAQAQHDVLGVVAAGEGGDQGRGVADDDAGAGCGRLADEYSGYQRVALVDYSRSLWREARDHLGDDPRFIVVRNDTRLGFYRNFERALRLVPADVELVALSDQDDVWHVDKLATLEKALEPSTPMATSDCRVVNDHGDEVGRRLRRAAASR